MPDLAPQTAAPAQVVTSGLVAVMSRALLLLRIGAPVKCIDKAMSQRGSPVQDVLCMTV